MAHQYRELLNRYTVKSCIGGSNPPSSPNFLFLLITVRDYQLTTKFRSFASALRAYNYRLGFFLDFTVQNNLRYLDQIDHKQLLRYVKFLRDHESDLDYRTVHNVFETLNTFLRTRDIFITGKILAELDYAEKPPKPYTKQELKDMFAAMDDEEKLLYGLFLNSGVRDAEMQNTDTQTSTGRNSRCTFSRRRGVSSVSRARARKNQPRTDSFRFRQTWFGKSKTE
jgi:hypothetical protein